MTVQPTVRTILVREKRSRAPASSQPRLGSTLLAAAQTVWGARLWLAAAALPVLAVGLLLVRRDEAVGDFEGLSSDRLPPNVGLDALWQLQDGHRPLIPRLLLLAVSSADLSPLTLTLLSVTLTLAAALLLWRLLLGEPNLGAFTRRRRLGLVPLLSVLLFSFSQAANWTTPWQIRVFASLVALTLGTTLLLGPPQQRPRLLCAMFLGWLAAYCFSSGLLYWIVLFPLAARPGPWREPRRTLWLSSAAACWLSFVPLAGDSAPPLCRSPIRLLSFAFTALGSPLFPHAVLPARLAGIAGGAALLFLGLRLLGRTGGRSRPWLVGWLALGAYAMGNAVLTGLGRAQLGPQRALVGASLSISLLLWISLAVLGLRWTENGDDPHLARRQWIVPFLLLATAFSIYRFADEASRFVERSRTLPRAASSSHPGLSMPRHDRDPRRIAPGLPPTRSASGESVALRVGE